jgi:ATP-dependent Clp protease ATP-binding subunit ClpC
VFERFTERARMVVVFAQDEARALKHNYIGTEHLLLGLLREEEGLAARVLDALDVTVEAVRAQVARIVGPGDEVTTGEVPFTPRAKKVLELALREALSLGHNYIGTEHILLGLVRENEGVAARILLDFDADAEKIRNEIIRMLSGSGRRQGDFPASGWMAYAPGPRLRARGSTWSKLSEARDAALQEGNYDLARKLLELEIEARQQAERKAAEPPEGEVAAPAD